MHIINIKTKLIILLIFFGLTIKSYSQEQIDDIEVIGISPLPGIEIDRNKVPNASQSLKETDMNNSTATTIVDLLGEKLTGVTIKDVQNSPFQKNLDYRGFTAAPLLGESQGLAVYLNGTRINEGFGDTLQWELVPEAALTNIDLMSANPVFGLNALGGSLALTTKKGLFDLFECLCICLATSSLPEPAGPDIKILLSVLLSLLIKLLIFSTA